MKLQIIALSHTLPLQDRFYQQQYFGLHRLLELKTYVILLLRAAKRNMQEFKSQAPPPRVRIRPVA